MRKKIAALFLSVFMVTGLTTVVAAPAEAAPVRELHNWGRSRDDGLVTHYLNLYWYHVKNPGTTAYYHWAKAATLTAKININGAGYDCSPDWYDTGLTYHHTRYSVHVYNNRTGRNWNRSMNVYCEHDTIATNLKGLSDTPRMYWRTGENKVKVFIQDFYVDWLGVTQIKEHQFSGQLLHTE